MSIIKYISAAYCPKKYKHTKCPTGYNEWNKWAEEKSKTHTQERCPECGFFSIWVKKKIVK